MEWVETSQVKKLLRLLLLRNLWRFWTRVLRSERCWERAERCGSLERRSKGICSVLSSSKALTANELNLVGLELGCAWRSTEACLIASRTLSIPGGCTCTDQSSINARPFLWFCYMFWLFTKSCEMKSTTTHWVTVNQPTRSTNYH